MIMYSMKIPQNTLSGCLHDILVKFFEGLAYRTHIQYPWSQY